MNPVSFRLLTLNTWKCDGAYHDRMALMAPQLRALAPDAAALQECFLTDDGGADTAGLLGAATGLRAESVQARHKVRTFDGRQVASWSGQTLLSACRLLRSQALVLPSPPGDDDRRAQLVQLDVQGQVVTLGNVHLTHLNPPGDAGAPGWRARQLQAVLDAIDQWGPVALAVVCGDFNEDLSGTSMRGFMHGPRALQDTFELAGQTRAQTFFDDDGRGHVLDHVLLVPALSRASVQVAEAATVMRADRPDERGITPSDHSGLLVAFEIS